jgi:hypothetical protein
MAFVPRDAQAAQDVHHDLAVRLEPATRELRIEDAISVRGGVGGEFLLARRFTVEQVLVDGAPVAAPHSLQGEKIRWRVPLGAAPELHTIVVRYRGGLEPIPNAGDREVLHGLPPMVDPRGSFLPGGAGWYPEIGEASFTYRVSLDLPADQRGLVPGRLIDEHSEGGRYRATFAFTHPAGAIDLIAGPYQVREQMLRREDGDPLRLRTYFHKDLVDLSDDYLSAVTGYVKLYSRWIGPYPFTEFSVVSSPLPTGFGMPTLTYLGVDVLKLPFIRTTSLGHEILHNWWGNGVYVDFDRGNWSEGLTAFMADYTYKEREGPDAARGARLELLRDIASVPPGQDMPLRQFTSRSHGTSQIVGYHKGTFLFLMLRDLIGPSIFDAGLRRFWREQQFHRASWADLRRAFEDASGKDLGGFFDQWLSRRGAPRFTIETARADRAASGHRIRMTIAQDEPAYAATVPVVVTTQTERVERRLDVAAARQQVVIEVPARPESVTLDPDFRILRQLDTAEMPPILRQLIVDPATVTIAATTDGVIRSAAADLASALLDYGLRLEDPAAPPVGTPWLVIGLAADVDRFLARANLPRRPQNVDGRGTAQVWTAYQPNGKALAVVSAENADALRALLRPLPHYGRQSYLIFEGSRAIERGVWPTQPPTWRFAEERQ